MTRSHLSLVCAALAFLPAAQSRPGAGPVRAERYRLLVFASGLDVAHGDGQWIDELYLPDHRVVCNVVNEMDEHLVEQPRMRAFDSPIRNVFAETAGGKETVHPTTPVQLPRELADQILALAELTRKQAALSLKAGAAARQAGVLPAK